MDGHGAGCGPEVFCTAVDAWEPDLHAFPALDRIDVLEVIQEPGDILHLPAWMWHHVENLEHCVGVRYGYPNLREAFARRRW
jgi:ribosomal protein L16 Arg81 hydroxylase